MEVEVEKIYKYGTGDEVPMGAKYLWSCVEEVSNTGGYGKHRLVWHYFLVKVKVEVILSAAPTI